jgi:hypothetical protein
MSGTELLRAIVGDVGDFLEHMVFTGGLVLPLYLTRPPRLRIRPTRDADVVVACESHAAWVRLQMELGALGVIPIVGDPSAPICRMRTATGHLLDLMPANPAVLGFGNPWFQAGYDRAITVEIGAARPIRIFPAALYVAAKIEAYRGRGKADPWMSHDLEDLLTLMACRASLVDETRAEPDAVKEFLRNAAREILALARLDELNHAHIQEPHAQVVSVLSTIAAN